MVELLLATLVYPVLSVVVDYPLVSAIKNIAQCKNDQLSRSNSKLFAKYQKW
jgi:hypothetical protein